MRATQFSRGYFKLIATSVCARWLVVGAGQGDCLVFAEVFFPSIQKERWEGELDVQRRGIEAGEQRGAFANGPTEDGIGQPTRFASELHGGVHRCVIGNAHVKYLVEPEPQQLLHFGFHGALCAQLSDDVVQPGAVAHDSIEEFGDHGAVHGGEMRLAQKLVEYGVGMSLAVFPAIECFPCDAAGGGIGMGRSIHPEGNLRAASGVCHR